MLSRPPGSTDLRTLADVLQSTADVLFPDDAGREVALDSRDADGDTPLHVLLWREDVDGARQLIAAGADVDAVGDLGETPLHVAVRRGLVDAVEMLLLRGANPDLACVFGDTARERALRHGGPCADCFRAEPSGPPSPPLPDPSGTP
ncbi:MAG: ankyrin repeat domain-containing protein [Arenimonas sp.]